MPSRRMTITRTADAQPPARYVLLVGADTTSGETHMRREDLSVDYLVRTEAVTALLSATARAR